ncbi:alpha/beta fold hydrolase [Streptomyces sp. NPDC101393]|uniref:alpha/beta fold hydrolase n=1 Tax=Streptomyces sp. NPDC101393 TaxID=3366141 RepID=UPI003802AD82
MGAQRQEQRTRSGVRLRRVASGAGRWNWLFLPGGPGLGSQSLQSLVEVVQVPGSVWLVDLPGDGSHRDLPGVPDPYAHWPDVLVEAAQALDDVVMVGHSTGGMFMLSVPELEEHLAGMALVSSAPHAGWRTAFARYAQDHPIPAVDTAAERYAAHPNDQNLRDLTLAAAPWNFSEAALAEGRSLLEGLPYHHAAVAWADAHFDDTYQARWSPQALPTLIVSGAQDQVVTQHLWQTEPAFTGPHILRRRIEGGGHFPWIENPEAVRASFTDLTEHLDNGTT